MLYLVLLVDKYIIYDRQRRKYTHGRVSLLVTLRTHCTAASFAPRSRQTFAELRTWLPAASTLVFNDTKVVPARIVLYKKSGARIEVFLLEPVAPKVYEEAMCSTSECEWQCLIGNAKKWSNEPLMRELAQGGLLSVTHQPSADGKAFIARFRWDNGQSFSAILQEVGQIPIPPYLNRETQAEDALWYQTVYAHWEGSVAAPTAGLHFSQDMLNDLKKNRGACHACRTYSGSPNFFGASVSYTR